MLKTPLVSVIVPTYNRASILEDALKSALSQTYTNTEIIVVDDGSCDNTRELIAQYPNIQYIYQKNSGQAAARNKGLEVAKGDFIASLDSDDVWNSYFLEKCMSIMQEENLDFTFANWMQERKHGKPLNSFSGFHFLHPYMSRDVNKWNLLVDNELRSLYLRNCPSPSSSMLIRRSSLVSVWNSELNIADDWCIILDMIMAKECRAAFTYDTLWTKRVGSDNIFDGRELVQIIKLLSIEDGNALEERYAHALTKEELRAIRKIQVEGLFTLSLHVIGTEFKIREGIGLFRRAYNLDSATLWSSSPTVFSSLAKDMVKKVIRR